MFSNKKYRNESPEAIRISNCLKEIIIELQTLRDIKSDGYNLMYIEEMAGILVNLKHILEGGDDND